MFSDLDKSSGYLCRRSFKEGSLDICDSNTLKYSALYEDLLMKRDSIDKQGYTAPAILPVGDNGVVDIRPLLHYDGAQFVNMAYMCILGRVPERGSLIALEKALAADSSREAKMTHLKAIGTSEEAKLRGTVITGFDRIDINEFYRYSDREFIEFAFIRILMRRPDAQGGLDLLSLLRSVEYAPAEILYMIRHSEEGEKQGVEIVGLDEAYRKRMSRKKLMNIPVIGRCGRYALNLLRTNRRINELKNENYRLMDMLYGSRNSLNEGINNVTQRMNAIDGRTDALFQQNVGFNGEITKLSSQSAASEERLSDLEKLSGAAEKRFTEFEEKSEASEERLSGLEKFSGTAEERFTELEEKSEASEERLSGLEKLSGTAEERFTELESRSETMESSLRELDTFTHQIGDNVNSLNSIVDNHEKLLAEQSASITQLAKDADNRTASLENSYRELDNYTHQIGDNVNELNKSSEEHSRLFSEQSDAVSQLSAEMDRRSISYENGLNELNSYAHQIGGNVSDINKSMSDHDRIIAEYVNEDKKTIQMLLAEVFKLKTEIKALKNGSMINAGTGQSRSEISDSSAVPASDVYSSIEYFDFENHFRGSREHVKSVQKIYLPYFESRKNVLDLGCGRGEFTELLKENNVGVTGVDMYEPYVEYMKSLGLPVVLDDAVAYLSRQESTDGIFMGQVVEHMSPAQIVNICNLAYEKLEEGSCLIMETPNPRSLAIYTECFYMDPSHQKPVHPFTLKYIAEKAGFSQVDILYTDSSRLPFSIPKIKEDEPDFEKFNEAMEKVSELLYGSQDYAVIARK